MGQLADEAIDPGRLTVFLVIGRTVFGTVFGLIRSLRALLLLRCYTSLFCLKNLLGPVHCFNGLAALFARARPPLAPLSALEMLTNPR